MNKVVYFKLSLELTKRAKMGAEVAKMRMDSPSTIRGLPKEIIDRLILRSTNSIRDSSLSYH
jgi:hypothetical protein